MENPRWVWMDGEFVSWDKAQIHVMSHSLHYGFGCFEGIRAYKTTAGPSIIFRLREHIERLLNSAKICEIKVPFAFDEIQQACVDTLIHNQLDEGYIRPLIFLGANTFGINPTQNPVRVAVATWKWGTYLGKDALEKGIKTKISSYTRFNPNSAMQNAKTTGNYALSVLAKSEAIKYGYQEAIFLDGEGYVAEGSGENIFIVCNGRLITPPGMSILPGITRDTIMTLAKNLGLTISEQRFGRDLLYVADEAFFTGTAAEVTPIHSVDDRVIGTGSIGPITRQLQEMFFKHVRGESANHPQWLTQYHLSDTPSSLARKKVTEADEG